MSEIRRIPSAETINAWYEVSRVASVAMSGFFASRPKGLAVPLGDNTVVSQHHDHDIQFSLTKFEDEGLTHVSFKRSRLESQLDIFDPKSRMSVCPYNTVKVLDVELETIVSGLRSACFAMTKQMRPKDGIDLPLFAQRSLIKPL